MAGPSDKHRALEALLDAISAEREATATVNNAIDSARQAGNTWSKLVSETGMSISSLRWRVKKNSQDWPSLARLATKRASNEPKRPAVRRDRTGIKVAGQGTGISISVAAEKLAVSRTTVNNMIADGRLETVMNGPRRLVKVDHHGMPLNGVNSRDERTTP